MLKDSIALLGEYATEDVEIVVRYLSDGNDAAATDHNVILAKTVLVIWYANALATYRAKGGMKSTQNLAAANAFARRIARAGFAVPTEQQVMHLGVVGGKGSV